MPDPDRFLVALEPEDRAHLVHALARTRDHADLDERRAFELIAALAAASGERPADFARRA